MTGHTLSYHDFVRVIFQTAFVTVYFIFNYNETNIEIVKEFNYLGIYFSRTGSFKVCKKHFSEKAIKAMYEVR
jgi:hypothetical protein